MSKHRGFGLRIIGATPFPDVHWIPTLYCLSGVVSLQDHLLQWSFAPLYNLLQNCARMALCDKWKKEVTMCHFWDETEDTAASCGAFMWESASCHIMNIPRGGVVRNRGPRPATTCVALKPHPPAWSNLPITAVWLPAWLHSQEGAWIRITP